MKRVIITICLVVTGIFASWADERTDTIHRAESIFGELQKPLSESWFTWGVDVGTSIDVDGYDMSTFDVDAFAGYKSDYFRTLGIGTGVHRDFHDGHNFIPLYVMARTAFSRNPRPWFLNFKTGYSFNTVRRSDTKGGYMLNAGIGFSLKDTRRLHMHILVSYSFFHLDNEQGTMVDKSINHIDMIQLMLGVNF